jgi:hypothetical protein
MKIDVGMFILLKYISLIVRYFRCNENNLKNSSVLSTKQQVCTGVMLLQYNFILILTRIS